MCSVWLPEEAGQGRTGQGGRLVRSGVGVRKRSDAIRCEMGWDGYYYKDKTEQDRHGGAYGARPVGRSAARTRFRLCE